MRFADAYWQDCEPDWELVIAASYLEAKGYEFNGSTDKSFSVHNVREKAEAVYRMEMMEGTQCGPITPPTEP